MDVMIHPLSDVKSSAVGSGTSIWQFCTVLSGATIGEDCNICANVFIENEVCIGNRVTVKCGVQLWNGVTIEDDVFIGPNVTFTNDKFPRSKQHPERYARTVIKRGASVGANATILPVVIGQNAMIGAGSVITDDVPPYAIVLGNPGRIVGYVGVASQNEMCGEAGVNSAPKTTATMREIPSYSDMRGSLSVIEWEKQMPFQVRRIFYTYATHSSKVRGEHAHKKCHQFLIAVSGSVNVIADDGTNRDEFVLDSPSKGLYLPPGLWGIQYKHEINTVLLVLASHEYDKDDYIRDYSDFVNYKKDKGRYD
jgi:acetyltransferase-like isoleucine patch superfamily enzyme